MDAPPLVQQLTRQVASAALTLHLAALPAPRYRPAHSAAVYDTLTYLRDTLRGHGWRVVEQPCVEAGRGVGANIIATLPGTTHPQRVVLVGAHHDTVQDCPGADDNGSGLAALLELARLLAPYRWESSIQLVAFDFEEHGFAGSRAYVEALRGQQLELLGAFILEMIGYSSDSPDSQQIPPAFEQHYPEPVAALNARGRRGDFLAVLGATHAAGLLERYQQAAALAAPELPLVPLLVPVNTPLRDLLRSDHLPFWEAGLPALQLTDTANFRNPNYHLPTDAPGTLDPAFWRQVVATTVAAVALLAGPVIEDEF